MELVLSFIHIMDLAEGHVLALEYLLDNNNKNIKLNLGTGKEQVFVNKYFYKN